MSQTNFSSTNVDQKAFDTFIHDTHHSLKTGKSWLQTDGQQIEKDGRFFRAIKYLASLLKNVPVIGKYLDFYTKIRIDTVFANYVQFLNNNKECANKNWESHEVLVDIASLSKKESYKASIDKTKETYKTTILEMSAQRKQDIEKWMAELPKLAAELQEGLLRTDHNKTHSFSFISLVTALGMTLKGIEKEEDKQKLLAKLGPGLDEQKIHLILNHLKNQAQLSKESGATLIQANAVAVKGHLANSPCVKDLEMDYQAQVLTGKDGKEVAQKSNEFVSKTTAGQIPKLLDDMGDMTAVLLNAVFFKAQWAEAFEAEKSSTASFTNLDGSIKEARFMQQESSNYSVANTNNMTLVEKAYKTNDGTKLSFVACLPTQGGHDALCVALNDLTKTGINHIRGQAQQGTEISLHLPRLNIDNKYDTMHLILDQLGYDIDQKALPRLSASSRVDAIIHQTKVKLDEEGTVAAAATGVCTKECCPPSPREVKFDRPFIYYIMLGDIPLFQGVVAGDALEAPEVKKA